jgi:hypothetical protein
MRLMIKKGWKGRAVLTVELPVTRRDLARGVNAARPGRYLFRGAWYGRDLTSIETYGKIEGQQGMPIGKLAGRPMPYLLRKLGARTTKIWVDEQKRDRPRSTSPSGEA